MEYNAAEYARDKIEPMVDLGMVQNDRNQPCGASDTPTRPEDSNTKQHTNPQIPFSSDERAGYVHGNRGHRRSQHPDPHQHELPFIVASVDGDRSQDDGPDELS
ncbi:MAG: hypothetical protein M1813_007762 [Trichoglossum hirsutum]|nr:MAG: hypothetical protein M1813_007762 [Trichoglossum hirsutum]